MACGRAGPGLPALRPEGKRAPAAAAAEEARRKGLPAPPANDARPPPPEKGSLGRKCLRWLRRKGAAAGRPPEGQAASRSRLCAEAAHESPIQAVRKASPGGGGGGARGVGRAAAAQQEERTCGGAMGAPALLGKLLCLKAAPARPKGAPHASPPFGASPRGGPVAALSRAADPHGESPLRWRAAAAAGSQGPAAAAAAAAQEDPWAAGAAVAAREEAAAGLASRRWRAFWEAVAGPGAKRRPPPPPTPPKQPVWGEGGRGGLGERQRSPSLPRGQSACAEPPGGLGGATAEAREPPAAAFPLQGPGSAPDARENGGGGGGGCGSCPPGAAAETPRPVGEGIAEPGREGGRSPEASSALPTGKSLGGEGPGVPERAPEGARRQAWARALSGRNWAAAAGEAAAGGSEEGWPGEEEPALAELAEQPGGQGMLMGTRDLGWLHRELLAGATLRTAEPAAAVAAADEDACPGAPAGGAGGQSGTGARSPAAGAPRTAASFLPPPPPPVRSRGAAAPPGVEEAGGLPPGGVTRGEGLPLPPPRGLPAAPPADTGKGGGGQRPAAAAAPSGKPRGPPGAAERRAAPQQQPEAWGAGAEAGVQALHWAAVEIVGAAIDAAAAQLAHAEEQEQP